MRLAAPSGPRPVPQAARPLGSLGRKTALGVGMTLAQNVGMRAVGFLAQLALARFLSPSEFGQIGLVLSVNALVQPVMDFGVEDVLMSRRKSLRLWIGPAYGLSITLGMVASLLLAAAAPVAGAVYHDPGLVGLVLVMAVSCALYAFSIIPDARLRSDMRFGVVSIYATADMIAIQCLTLLLAWRGLGAYAFVLPLPISSVMRSIILRQLAPVSLRGAFRVRRWRHLLSRGALVFGRRILQVGREQGDYFVLGLMTSPAVLGAYFFAFRLAAQPVYMLVRSLSVVLFPALASLGTEPDRQVDAAIRASRILGLVVTPFSFLLAGVAQPMVLLLFGPRWSPSVPYIQILSVALAFDVLPCVAGALATARGLFRLQLRLAAGSVAFFLICILAGVALDGAIGVAFGVFAFFFVSSIASPMLVFRPMHHRTRRLVRLWIEPVATAGIATAGGLLAAAGLQDGWLLARITVTLLVGGLVYGIVLRVCAPGLTREVTSNLSDIMRRRGRHQPA